MVRMEVADAAVNEIMATTFRVPVKRLILIKGLDHQDELEEISHRTRELDPDVMTDLLTSSTTPSWPGCAPSGTGSRHCPPSRTGGTSSSPGSCTPTSTRLSPLGNAERG